jgi:ADP-ribosylglycohydrolase
MKNKTLIALVVVSFLTLLNQSCTTTTPAKPVSLKISSEELQDKIKGGWAGQVIGCTFGGPTEFRYEGTMIQDYQPIQWDNDLCKWFYENRPGLYDDIYMDLTFVDVFEKEGLDAPASSHAKAFANADYSLWHANQAARYNILRGIMPPESGHWLYNPHSEDIDFQIEADFAGLMSPGMVNTASAICDKVGHIMNYGDGWYGGVYVAAMYALAFVSDDIEFIVTEGLKSIPAESQFYQCMDDVIRWWKQNPDDWKQTWFECEKKWSSDIGCPKGVFSSFNIDAKINAAYIIIGLLYGEGDFGKTLEISTRCGQDSDCNPASAGGILGTMLGYKNIPEYWKAPLYPVEDMDFRYTTMSLNDVYSIGNRHAKEILKKNGAQIADGIIEIPYEEIKPVKLEVGFEGHFPKEKLMIRYRQIPMFPTLKDLDENNQELVFDFEGIGFVLNGSAEKAPGMAEDHTFEMEMYIDGEMVEEFVMPTDYRTRKFEVAWKYQLPEGKHEVKIRVLNPKAGYKVRIEDLLLYGSEEIKSAWKTE